MKAMFIAYNQAYNEEIVDLLAALKSKDEEAPDLGLRAFVWSIETFY